MEEMYELYETGEQWVTAASNYDANDFYGFVTAILKSIGCPVTFVGSSSMAEITDWLIGLLGPFGGFYELFISNIDTATFIKIVNWIFAHIGH